MTEPDAARPPQEPSAQAALDVPVAPVAAPPVESGRRIPILAIAIVIVALLAGGALFLSGYSMGRQSAAEPGTPLLDLLPIRDQVLDVTPTVNRVDLLSMVGVAREVAALLDGELHPPAPEDPTIVDPEDVEVTIEDFRRCPRYIGRVFRDVAVGPSPQWLRSRLFLADMRSISNVVDVTNYVMHVWGSPLHAFDRALLSGGRIVVRRAREGETLRTLDGTLRELRPSDLLITDGERAVALAAIMGRLESEVSETTSEVLLEAANFEPIGVLRTSERLALRTEGSNKWEKGVDPYAAEPAAVLASRLLVDLAGAEPIGAVDVNDVLPERPRVTLRPERATRLIGLDVPEEEQRSILERLGFEVDDAWTVTVPTWRARDVTREVDVIEEIARAVLDQVPNTMPLRRAVAVACLSVALTGGAMLLFALEGLVCLLMAAPIAGVVAVIGAILGRAIAVQAKTPRSHAAAAVLMLPGIVSAEAAVAKPELREVKTVIEVDAPPRADLEERIDRGGQRHVAVRLDLGLDGQWVKGRRQTPTGAPGVIRPVGLGRGPGFVAAEVDPIVLLPILQVPGPGLAIQSAVLPEHAFLTGEAELHHAADRGHDYDFDLAVAEHVRVRPAVIGDLFDRDVAGRGGRRRNHAARTSGISARSARPMKLQDLIRQDSLPPSQDAVLNVLATASWVSNVVAHALAPFGVTPAQYNVLRILKGAEPDGLCRNEIRDRMITRMPDMTRLLDRMEDAGLVARSRESQDRRMVNTRLTARGRRLLQDLEPEVRAEHQRRFGHLSEEESRRLIALLTSVRQHA